MLENSIGKNCDQNIYTRYSLPKKKEKKKRILDINELFVYRYMLRGVQISDFSQPNYKL